MNAEYITLPGDRWDLIAYKAYGTMDVLTLTNGVEVNAMAYIINNNPDIATVDVLPAGLLLQIPIIASTSVQTDKSLLPPWKN